MLSLVAGVAIAATGIALNENAVSFGRYLVIAGLLVSAAATYFLVFRRRATTDEGVLHGGPSAADTVAAVASRLGLECVVGRASGQVKHRRVELSVDSDEGPITIRALAVRKLDMGLSVMRSRPPGDARKEVRSGDEEFDGVYVVRVDQPERALQILTDRLREQLLSAHAQLDDSGVLLLLPPCDEESLAEGVKLADRVAAELDRASSRVGCAPALSEVREAWLRYAQDTKLASADTPLSLWGEIDDITVGAVAVRDAFQQYHFELTADFPEPLGRGLELNPASSTTQFDRDDELVGHPAFDKVFKLTARQTNDAARLIGPETRNAILALRNSGLQLRAHDRGLWAWVGFNPNDSSLVPLGLNRMVQIAQRISANAERFSVDD